ncbi:hypothetical protein [Actinomadura sp. 7K507]|uniref:hypothetical protein n=1 Tax=Actinomadura sp. 7K507 TaxID=2530365 RepID=UPI00104B3BA0|nr:hypothetical protein [Actinomadura sp. 7K507]TDC84022.1 hypothetical protein E1285_27585 [Actinomadura sp. 7K507]
MPSPARQVAEFDSATAMLRVLARCLDDRDAPLLGIMPGYLQAPMSALLRAAIRLPSRVTEKAYAMSGWAEAMSPDRTGDIRSEALAEWIVSHYPRRRYPAVFIGSSDGALVHLAAALSVPWLPQTVLIPVRRRGGHPDDSCAGLRLSEPAGHALVEANPDLVLHHMHDANQDRLMIAGMSYFRVKWRRLPAAYRGFLRDCLAPGGTIIVTDCGLRWPTTRIGERYVFQHGAYGGITAEEFHEGSPRVTEFLARNGSPHRTWHAPAPDGDSPEAEWGFDPSLLADLSDFPVHRLRFPAPQALSPAVADLYRAWYRQRGIPDTRMFASCFLLLEPWWTLRTGSVPYWLTFNTEPARRNLLEYLDGTDPYDEIRLTLFSNGVPALGQAPIPAWREVLTRARTTGTFTGVDTAAYPRDFAAFARMHQSLARVRPVYPMPDPLDLDFALDFLSRHP